MNFGHWTNEYIEQLLNVFFLNHNLFIGISNCIYVCLQGKNKTNYPSNHSGDYGNRRIEKVTALNLSKAEEVFVPNDLKFSPTATTPYDKLDNKWRSSPKGIHSFIHF